MLCFVLCFHFVIDFDVSGEFQIEQRKKFINLILVPLMKNRLFVLIISFSSHIEIRYNLILYLKHLSVLKVILSWYFNCNSFNAHLLKIENTFNFIKIFFILQSKTLNFKVHQSIRVNILLHIDLT